MDSDDLERRVMDGDLRHHLMLEMDFLKERQIAFETKYDAKHFQLEAKMDEVLTILKGSKILAKVISWLGGIAIAIAAVWTAMHTGFAR